MRKPLVSVIIPVYNREEFIQEAIKSILEQTFNDFELIVVDDGSSDKTGTKILEFKDPRIKIINNKDNLGVSAARNRGIKVAKGNFIAFMDSDDISAKDRLEKQLKVLNQKREVDICGSWVIFLGSGNLIKHKENHEEIMTLLLRKCSLSLGSVMYRRRETEEIVFNEQFWYGEDYELWSRIGWNWKMYNIQEPLLYYRYHEGQISVNNKKSQMRIDAEIRLSLFKKLGYSKKVFPDEKVKRILLFEEFFKTKDLKLYFKWINTIEKINFKKNIFSHQELQKVIKIMREELVFKIYFTTTNIGIDRTWRIRTLFMLDKKEVLLILKRKIREFYKSNFI